MRFENRNFTLKDGRKCVLRPTHPDDASAMIEYMKVTAGETPYLLRYPDEVKFTVESEREILGNILENEKSVMMMAEVDGRVAGNCSINGLGDKRKIIHRCSLAIALTQEFWDLGIGRAMLTYLLELAKEVGYEQVELEVVEGNGRARRLYEKCGFVETGKHFRALKYEDGTYRDEIIMCKVL